MSQLINYLGQNSYPGIVQQIAQKLASSKSQSLQANDMIQKAFISMNESKTPMMDLREFTTNAEQLAKTDATLSEILAFVTKNVKSGDLNFLVNMAKEEHFKEMTRAGFPDVEATIKAYSSEFNEPASIIEESIKKGIFDNLKSNLMMDLKSSFVEDGKTKINVPETVIKLNENNGFFTQNLIAYNPIAIRMEDVTNNRILFLTESVVLTYDRDEKEFSSMSNNEMLTLNVPEQHKRMMQAIQELTYNPRDNNFKPALVWDFDLLIDSAGEIIMSNGEKSIIMDDFHLPIVLMESIALYESRNPNFDKVAYLRDADNLIMLVENYGKMTKLDTLNVIKTLNENSHYVIVEPNSQKTPKLIASNTIKDSELFESYINLTERCSEILDTKITGLFESQINLENEFFKNKHIELNRLYKEKTSVVELMNENSNLLKIAEEGSPAHIRLFESQEDLLAKEELLISNINNFKNNHKLYL